MNDSVSKRQSDALRSISDEALFPLPRDLSTWEGCVKVWNDCLDFSQHWERVLKGCIARGEDGALAKEDFLLWDQDLDALVGRLQLAEEVTDRAFWHAVGGRYGLVKGDVIETDGDRETYLLQIEGGGLPRRGNPDDVRFTCSMVEPMCGTYISAKVGLPMVHGHPDSLSMEFKKRDDVRPIQANGSGVLPLPPELFEEVVEKMAREINPNGLSIDRKSVLIGFWRETIWRQRTSPWSFEVDDILRVKPSSGRAFHVVYCHSMRAESISCYIPKAKAKPEVSLLALGNLSAKSNKLSLAVAQSDFCRSDRKVGVEALMVMAMRETSRSRR
jgi:hypothetical protein